MCVRASVDCGLPTVPSATPLTQTECDAHVYVAHVWFRYGYVMVMVPPSTMLVCVCGRGAHVGRGEGLDPQPHNADGEARAQESSAEPYVSYQCGSQPQRWVELEAGANKQTGASPRVGPSCTSNRSWCAAAPRAGPNGRLYCSRHGNHPEAVPILALPIVSNAPVPRLVSYPCIASLRPWCDTAAEMDACSSTHATAPMVGQSMALQARSYQSSWPARLATGETRVSRVPTLL
mmetsp:Transcript_25978/g.59004  ORF Transcript_25978/g.59004 Transcript_25978/m.59004 type:complete len:234 (+) Transcript_25978:48-749(+)